MFWQRLPARVLAPKYYLNGFPKSGLHLVELMIQAVVKPMPRSDLHSSLWIGTFEHHSWSREWTHIPSQLFALSRLQQGHYFKGHSGYHKDYEQLMYWSGIAHIFIYRDLRDVAVSQTHHILSADDMRFQHPDKDVYRKLGGFDEVLKAVIEGLGPYPGVVERWEYYAPWLECDWMHAVSFERLRDEPQQAAREMLEYGFRRIIGCLGWEEGIRADDDAFDEMAERMVEAGTQTERSPTFRRGEVGGWREAFTEEHKAAFKAADEAGWLVKLGYEESEDW